MAIAVRGTTHKWSTSGSGFSIAAPSGTQVGDLLILLKQETVDCGNVSGWTDIHPSTPAIFDNGEDAQCAWRYDDGTAFYAMNGTPVEDITVSMIALYSDIGGVLTVDEATCILTEAEDPALERPPSPVFELQSVTTTADDSLLVGMLGIVGANHIPDTPSGSVVVEDSDANAGIDSGGFKIVTETRSTAGATGVRSIQGLGNTQNGVAGAFAVSETPPTEADLTATATVTALGSVTSSSSTQVAETAMGDYALIWGDGSADLALVDDDLQSDQGMRTAILLSLFTDRRANPDDELPADDGDRRGWWADEFAEIKGDLFGSRNWLLDRAKLTPDTVSKAKEYDDEALAWMVEDVVVARIVNTPRIERGVLWHLVEVFRPDGTSTTFKFAHVWTAEEAAV